MKNEFDFNEVTGRVKKVLKIKEDKQLAELLDLSASSFNGRKKTNSIPYDSILALANKENLDFNWLLTGKGNMYRNEVKEQSPTYQTKSISALETLFDRVDDIEKQLSELRKQA